jgi:nucleolar protein 58
VGAKLIAHAGSLLNLAKAPASTVQILGAEKALFRALKTKHDTPKYGLIYHASLVGQATQKLKGKIARTVATKAALSIRCDALGDKDTPEIGIEQRAKVEARLRQLEGRADIKSQSAFMKNKPQAMKHEMTAVPAYNPSADVTTPKKEKKRKTAEETPEVVNEPAKKKKKKSKD